LNRSPPITNSLQFGEGEKGPAVGSVPLKLCPVGGDDILACHFACMHFASKLVISRTALGQMCSECTMQVLAECFFESTRGDMWGAWFARISCLAVLRSRI